jgi:hypothetical protein
MFKIEVRNFKLKGESTKINTSISIEKTQKQFVDENNINLSAVVQAVLTEMMKQNKGLK